MDYCFANFDGYSYINSLGERVETDSAFDVVPIVKNFMKDVKDSIGEKILETYDDIPKQVGIISGNCFFGMERACRHLYVPAKNVEIFKDEKWKEEKVFPNFMVTRDIFEYPIITLLTINDVSKLIKNKNKRITYETDNSKEKYIGGSGPKETAISIGNSYVYEILGDKVVTIKTEKKVRVPIPNLF